MGTIESEIASAIEGAGSTASAEIVGRLTDGARTRLAIERFDQRRLRHRNKLLHVDRVTQPAFPGFEQLHAFYPNSGGVPTELDELSPAECRANAKRLRAEGAEWNVPRHKDEGRQKILEAEQLERWADMLEAKQERA